MELHLTAADVIGYVEQGVHTDFGLHVTDYTTHQKGGVTVEVQKCAEFDDHDSDEEA